MRRALPKFGSYSLDNRLQGTLAQVNGFAFVAIRHRRRRSKWNKKNERPGIVLLTEELRGTWTALRMPGIPPPPPLRIIYMNGWPKPSRSQAHRRLAHAQHGDIAHMLTPFNVPLNGIVARTLLNTNTTLLHMNMFV